MNTRHLVLVIAAAITFPVAGYAQNSSSTVTRAQVRAELIQLESQGYRPTHIGPDYPDAQIAEASVATQKGPKSIVASSVGGVMSGSSAAGNHVAANALVDSLYEHQ